MLKYLIAVLVTFGVGDVIPPVQGQLEQRPPETTAVRDVPSSSPVINPVINPMINDGGPDEIERVEEAVRRFEDYGLELPAVEITFSDDGEACDGYRGLYRPGTTPADHGVDQITICDDWPVHLYHELAHAWEHHAVADGTRTELLDRWGLITWSDQTENWESRGIEQAAKTISYTLGFDHLPVGLNVRRYVCAFELLTGMPLPAEVPVACGADTTTAPAPVDTASPLMDAATTKDPADDPRTAPNPEPMSSDVDDRTVPAWEHEGPGSNSMYVPGLAERDTP